MAKRTSQIIIKARDEASRAFEKVGRSSKSLMGRLFSLKGVIATAFGALALRAVARSTVGSFGSMGDSIAKMSKRTGVAVETLSEFQFVASQTGTEMGALETGFRRMQRSIYDAGRGLSTQTDALSDLGLTYAQLAGRKPEAQFKMLADAIGRLEDPTRKAALAQAIFGRSGTQLLPMFANGAAGINKLQTEARKLGLTISGEQARAAEQYTDSMDRMWKSVKMVGFQIGSQLAPALSWAGEGIASVASKVAGWVAPAADAIKDLFAKWRIAAAIALDAMGAILDSFGVKFTGVGDVVGTVVKAIKGWFTWWIRAGIAGWTFLEVVIINWKNSLELALKYVALKLVGFAMDVKHWLTVVIPDLLGWFKRNWKEAFTDLWNVTKAIFSNMYTNVVDFFKAVWSWLKGEGFDFEWTNLLAGFESTLKELPKIAERELTDLETKLGARVAELSGQIGREFQTRLAGRLKMLDGAAGADGKDGTAGPVEVKIAPLKIATPKPTGQTAEEKKVAALESRFLQLGASRDETATKTERNTAESVRIGRLALKVAERSARALERIATMGAAGGGGAIQTVSF